MNWLLDFKIQQKCGQLMYTNLAILYTGPQLFSMIPASKRRIHRVHHVRSEPHQDPWLWQSKWDIWTSTNTQQMDSGWLIGMLIIPNSANWWILLCWIIHLSFSTNQRVQGVLMLSQSHPPLHPLGYPSSYTESVVFFPFIAGASSKNGASWYRAWKDSKWRSLENEAFWCTVHNIFGNHERCCKSWTKKKKKNIYIYIEREIDMHNFSVKTTPLNPPLRVLCQGLSPITGSECSTHDLLFVLC